MYVTFELQLESRNLPFRDHPREELSRILKRLSEQIRKETGEETEGRLYDILGNAVGRYYLTLEK